MTYDAEFIPYVVPDTADKIEFADKIHKKETQKYTIFLSFNMVCKY